MAGFRAKLAAAPQMGLSIMYPSPGTIERIGPEWDWMWIDAQHGELAYPDVLAMVRACELAGPAAIVRVAWNEAGLIGMALDTGCEGVIVPCVDTVDEARAAVAFAKFPPLGRRSYGGRRPIDRHGRGYSDTANADVMLIVQIESPQALENADAIAAIPGVDGLFLGPDDVALRRGMSMTAPRPASALEPDLRTVAEACKKHRKVAVTAAIGEPMIRMCRGMGYTMLACGSDVMFLATGSKTTAAQTRALLAEQPAEQPKAPATPTLY